MRKVLFLFGQLNDDDVEWLIASGAVRQVARGEVLIRQGTHVDAVFILLAGRLSVLLARTGDREIARLHAGEIVGEMSFLDSRPPSATVRALEDSTVYAIPRRVLAARLAADLGFAARFYRALAIFLATTVRERHRGLVLGAEGDAGAREAFAQVPGASGASGMGGPSADDEDDDADELDANVLDNVYLAGERFNRMVRRLTGA
jgi:CRP/FNR family cyclic AMP-dependent transcriptional regulator